MESEPMLTPREKSPLPEKFSSEEDRANDAASSRTASPTQYQQAQSAPQQWICLETFTCCHTEIEITDQTCFLALKLQTYFYLLIPIAASGA